MDAVSPDTPTPGRSSPVPQFPVENQPSELRSTNIVEPVLPTVTFAVPPHISFATPPQTAAQDSEMLAGARQTPGRLPCVVGTPLTPCAGSHGRNHGVGRKGHQHAYDVWAFFKKCDDTHCCIFCQ